MKIYAYVWQLKEQESIVLQALLTQGTKLEFEIKQLFLEPNFKIPDNSISLCFGPRTHNIIKVQDPNAILLPSVSQLIDTPKNKEARNLAWQIVNGLESKIGTTVDSSIELTSEDISKNLTFQYGNLKKMVDQSKEYWIGTIASGKKILIADDNHSNITHNFQMTFEELYAAKLAFEILGLTSLSIVKGKNNDN